MTTTWKRRVSITYWWTLFSDTKKEVDSAVAVGADSVILHVEKAEWNAIKAGGTDYFKEYLDYAHSKGLNVAILFSTLAYCVGTGADEKRAYFKNTPAVRTTIRTMMEWIVSKYPTLDGIMMEELQGGWGTVAEPARTEWLNLFKTEIAAWEAIVRSKHLKTSNFEWAFNTTRDTRAGQEQLGFPANWVYTNGYFNTVGTQNMDREVGDCIDGIPTSKRGLCWKERYRLAVLEYPGYLVYSFAYSLTGTMERDCLARYGLAYPLNHPECYNQGFFDELKFAKANNITVGYFPFERRKMVLYQRWTGYTAADGTVEDEVRRIWGGTTPPGKGYLDIISSPSGTDITLNGGHYGITPRTGTPGTTGSITLVPGTYALKLTLAGYDDYTEDIVINSGLTTFRNITLNPSGCPIPGCGVMITQNR